MLFKVPFGISIPGYPATVTFPGLRECRNWRGLCRGRLNQSWELHPENAGLDNFPPRYSLYIPMGALYFPMGAFESAHSSHGGQPMAETACFVPGCGPGLGRPANRRLTVRASLEDQLVVRAAEPFPTNPAIRKRR